MLLAMLPAMLPEEKALPAMLDAWLNLSQRENANEFVMVSASAIAGEKRSHVSIIASLFKPILFWAGIGVLLTDQG